MTAAMYKSLASAHQRISDLYTKEAHALDALKKPRKKKTVKKKAAKR